MLLLLLFLFFSCGQQQDHPTVRPAVKPLQDTLKKLTAAERQARYMNLRNSIAGMQQQLSDATVNEARQYILSTLTDSIFPYWYDTPWDFNGTTQEPQQGSIACGFFISTTLQHAGFNIDRIKCGQQASSVFINIMCKKSSVKWISNNDTVKLVKHLLSQPDGLYLIGLDYHTGFIQKQGTDLWMIHAAFWPHYKVVKERVQESAHIKESKIFMVGDLLGNDELVRKWMKKERIEIE